MRWCLPIIALLAFAVVILLLREWGCDCECQEPSPQPPAAIPMRVTDGPTFLV